MREGKEKPAAQLVEASRPGPHEARAKEVIALHVKSVIDVHESVALICAIKMLLTSFPASEKDVRSAA